MGLTIRRGWTIRPKPEQADGEERRQRRLLDTEFRRWAERPPQPSPEPEEEGPVQLGQAQGLLNLRPPQIRPPSPDLAEAFAPEPSSAFGQAPMSAWAELERRRRQRGAGAATAFGEDVRARSLQEAADIIGLSRVAEREGLTPQALLARPRPTEFEQVAFQREVELEAGRALEELTPSGGIVGAGQRAGQGLLQMLLEAEALERKTLGRYTRPVGRAVAEVATEAVVPQVPRPLRALGVPDFPGREAVREAAGAVGEVGGEFGILPSNLLPIPIADDILRILAKGVPIAARLLTRTGRQATRAELRELAAGARRFLTRTPPTDPAERQVLEQAAETLSREAVPEVVEEVTPVVAREAAEELPAVREQNFVQFLRERGTPNLDEMDHGLLSPSGRVSARARNAAAMREQERLTALGEAQRDFQGLVDSGAVVDPTGRYTQRPAPPARAVGEVAEAAPSGPAAEVAEAPLPSRAVTQRERPFVVAGRGQTQFGDYVPPKRVVAKRGFEPDAIGVRVHTTGDYYGDGFVLVRGTPPEGVTQKVLDFSSIIRRDEGAGRLKVLGEVLPVEGEVHATAFNPKAGRTVKPGLALTTDDGRLVFVSKERFDHVASRYPQATLEGRGPETQITFVENGEVVGAVMPVRIATDRPVYQQAEDLLRTSQGVKLRARPSQAAGEVAEVGPPRLETVADDAARMADEGLPPVAGGTEIGLPSPHILKSIDEIAVDVRRSTQNAFGALSRGAARFPPLRTLVDFVNPTSLIDRPPASLVEELGEEGASQLQANLIAHARSMDQGTAIASAIEEGVQQRARAVGLHVQDGLVVSIEGSPPVGDLFENPSRYTLTREQRALVDEVQVVLNDTNAVEKAAGVKKGEIFSGEGRYFPRLVREVRGVENIRANVRRIVGAKQGFTRERFYSTMQEGMDAGVRYEDDIGAIVGTRIRAGMKAAGDESLAQLIRPLGRTLKAPRTTVGIGEMGTMVPAIGGRAFPPETARVIMDALNPAPPGSTLRFLDTLNNFLRPLNATAELSFWGIQMMSSIFRNPAAFAKGALHSLDGLILDGRLYGRYVQNNASWLNRFIAADGVWNSSEFTFDQAIRNKTIRNVFGKLGLKGAIGRFDQAFNQGLNITALENFKGMVGLGDSVGFDKFNRAIRAALGDFAGETVDEVAASVSSKMTGRLPVRGLGVKATQRSVESSLAFAARYYRAMFGLLGDALQGGMRGAESRRVLGSLFAGAIVTHVAAARALGQDPNLDPRNSNWLTVRIGNQKVGIGGPIYGLGRMLAESVENPEKLKTFSMDSPLVRWARGRTAPVLSLATDLVTQETFMGKKIDSLGDLVRELATTPLPFIAQQAIEEGPEAIPPQALGLRAFPVGTRERFEELYQEKYGTAPQPDISPRQLDPELAAQAGYDPARETEFGAERAGITAGEEGRLADLSRIVLTGQPEAMEQFEEELGDFFRFRSGVTETLVRDLGLPEREASLVQDFYDLDPRDRRDPETGKPDWDRFESQRERILSRLRREGSSGREAARALERGTGISFPDPDLQRVYDARQSLREGLDAYYDTESKKREAYRRRNPEVDAKLYLLGRVSRVVTRAAQGEVRSLSRRLLGTEVEAGRGERRERRFGEPIRIGPLEPIAIGR